MDVETFAGERLRMVRIGDEDSISDRVICINQAGEKIELQLHEIRHVFGSFSFPPVTHSKDESETKI